MIVKAVDVSNWTGDLSDAFLDALKAAGFLHVIVRLSLESKPKTALAMRQLTAILRNAMLPGGYGWVYPDTKKLDIAAMLGMAESVGATIPTLWLDVENAPGVPTPELVRALADYCLSKGQRVGIYTGRYYWRMDMLNSGLCADLPLWLANYTEAPNLEQVAYFGGWVEIAGHQYTGTGTIGGFGDLDLSVFRAI